MNPIKKMKGRRGMTLAEVLIVVAIMALMVGIAMPNLLARSQDIKLATMDGMPAPLPLRCRANFTA